MKVFKIIKDFKIFLIYHYKCIYIAKYFFGFYYTTFKSRNSVKNNSKDTKIIKIRIKIFLKDLKFRKKLSKKFYIMDKVLLKK
jgi:hypothetical protein